MMPSLTAEQARSLICMAVQAAKEQYGRPICVAVCDAYGFLLAFERMDGAPVRSIAISQGKAYTAVRTGVPTHEFLARIQRENIQAGYFCDPLLTALPGGSIMRNPSGEIVGGIGVSALATHEDQSITETVSRQLFAEL